LSKPVLTVILGRADLATQRGHLDRGALFLPEPEPLPEPFVEIVLRVEDAAGNGVDLDGRVLQILPGRGIAVSFDDMAGAKKKLAPLFEAGIAGTDEPTYIFWGRGTMKKLSSPAPNTIPAPPIVDNIVSIPQIAIKVPLELNETMKLEAEIAAMSAPQKIQFAMKADRAGRVLLLKEPNKTIQTFLLQNPRITIEEVKHIAGFRQAGPEALNAISVNREWTGNPGVVSALVRNPKTPGPTAVKLMEKLSMDEIRRLAKSNDVPPAVTAAARKKVAAGK
jgi:hypothetical protein